ncbi:DUF3078 domain-containing protein [Mucilaginibacter sp. KACC 22063]|uniref:DUF3078 domain-containing protein n=1 Tax=Mucilaginibacter sp. KACC 22063 TaxID=3025666 RepID=UPI0023655781|nr:DUF3078 domain-containing protein [Mucilaginibacter sp. KACC 22063]WDF55447.1 DUF3078 domain-containing protein [Mucilaginibacter sp. KACC 22063]
MLKNAPLLLLIFFFAATFKSQAQITDSLLRRVDSLQHVDSLRKVDSLARLDTVKIDTGLLNRYRIAPRNFQLPVISRPVYIDPNLVPVTLLDYKISYWRKWIQMGINLNQSAFSNNWSGGGQNSLALGGNFDYKTEYNKAPFDYTGELLLMYGKSRNEGHVPRKTNDRIFFDNKIATQMSKSWYFFGSLSFESQFDEGFQYDDSGVVPPLLISRFMAPGYITESLGFEYKPNKVFDLRIGTGTARQTFVLDTTIYHNLPTNYGVKPGHTFLNELAFQAVAVYDKDIMANLHLNARYALFIPYGRSLANIDHRLDMVLNAKVNRLISVTINATALYDKDTSDKLQATEGLALGILYKFP